MHCAGSSVGKQKTDQRLGQVCSVSGLSRVHRPGATGRLEGGSGRTAWVMPAGRDWQEAVTSAKWWDGV